MKLTQVGFIDMLRKVTQDKYQTLSKVKEHFVEKVDKVIQSKDYQIRCQRIVAIESAKKVVDETTRDSNALFNKEVNRLVMQYSRSLDLIGYFENVVKNQAGVIALQEKILSKLSLKMNGEEIQKKYKE